MSNDPNDTHPPNPGHILAGTTLAELTDPNVMHVHENRLPLWREIQQLNQHLVTVVTLPLST